MSYAGFASLVDAPASPRSSRLLLASAIACSSLALALAVAFTLERMSILRMPGPKTRYEVASVAIAEPPKIVDPPPKPEEVAAAGVEHDASPTIDRPPPTILETRDADRSTTDTGSDTLDSPGIPGGPPGGGAACLGGVCGKGPIGIPGGDGSCIGPQCKPVKMKPSAPKSVSFESLGCIACADPTMDALRTAAGLRTSGGTNVTRFCVDSTGHVEAGSVETETSHGDPAIDRVCRDAVKRWRFSPAKVGGEGRRACSEATFRIDFE